MNEEEQYEEKSKIQETIEKNQHNAASNTKVIRNANAVLKNMNVPYASAIAKGLDTADKYTGGLATKAIGHGTNFANKAVPGGKIAQKATNELADSKALGIANKVANIANLKKNAGNKSTDSKTSNSSQQSKTNNKELKKEIAKEAISSNEAEQNENKRINLVDASLVISLIPIAAIFGFVIIILLMIIVMATSLVGSFSASASAEKIEACRNITVVNTENNLYDGEVGFEDYIAGVLAAKGLNTNNVEYYKAIAIETRTKVLSQLNGDCQIDGNEDFLPYIDVEESPYQSTINKAVNDTSGIIISNSDFVPIIEEAKIPYEEAINLINTENYSYKDIINKYYGTDDEKISLTDANRISISKTVDGFINPVTTGYCTSPFGYRIHPIYGTAEGHNGLDIGRNMAGTPIYAAKSGTVVAVVRHIPGFENKSYGNYVKIDHGDGTITQYCHMLFGSIPAWINVGTYVEQGEKIGGVGSTGTSTGAHLHYMVLLNGQPQNPADYIDTSTLGGTCR